MKSINSFIIEKLKVSKSKPGDCTLEEFLVWYYFDNNATIKDLTFEEFSTIDFDPYVLSDYFDNDSREMYDFLMDHLDDEIELSKTNEAHHMCYSFFIDDINFMVEITNDSEFLKK